MNRYSHLTRLRMFLAATFSLVGLGILLLVSYPDLISAEKIPPGPRSERGDEKIASARLEITNRCPQSHHFRIKSDISDPRFKQETDAVLIG
jgi:hypothetical protein